VRLALPATVWVLAVFALPTAFLLAGSVLTYDGADVTGPLTGANYADLFGNPTSAPSCGTPSGCR
jgi:putative spermidine/putrescine transport system permease protein